MKIIGPIAGIGSRLRPFTFSKPKAFIRVAGKTVLDHILTKFTETFDSKTELVLIVGYKKQQIINYIQENYQNKFQLTFIEQIPRDYEDNIPYFWGLGEAVYLSHERFQNEDIRNTEEDKKEGSLIFLSDMILLDDYEYILEMYNKSDVDGIITVMEVSKENASSYGIVVVDENGFIKELVEKPKEYISNLAIAGIYAFSNKTTQALFKHIKKYLDKRTEDSKEVFLTESLQDLVNDGFRIAAVELNKGILDFGQPAELLKGNKYLLEQKSVKAEDFKDFNITVERSHIEYPVYIGKNTKIINSVIGPNVSIGENSKIENCILSNSLIEKEAVLKKVISSHSIIGSNVRGEDRIKDSLLIGDNSEI